MGKLGNKLSPLKLPQPTQAKEGNTKGTLLSIVIP
jgi:hypothetical protein